MNFYTWFQTFQDANGICAYETDDLRAAYEAGQRDMRERAAAECAEVVKRQPYFAPSPSDYADAIREIKLESEP